MPSQTYDYCILPCDYESVTQWAPKFINYRLNALKTDPKLLIPSYEHEATISEQEWISLLSKPQFRVLLCIARDVKKAGHIPVWENEWAGIMSLYGPRHEYQPVDDCTTSTWWLGNGYVSSAHRGHGIVVKIFRFGEQEARKYNMRLQNQRRFRTARYRTCIQITVKADEESHINYYATTGLQVTEPVTPGEYSRRGWNISVGDHMRDVEFMIMEKVIEENRVVMSHL